MAEEPCESPPVVLGQPGAVGIEPLQEAQEVLLGAARGERVLGVGLGAWTVKAHDLGVEVEEAVLAGQQSPIRGRADLTEPALLHQETVEHGWVQVIPEEETVQRAVHAFAQWLVGVGLGLETAQVDRLRTGGEVSLGLFDPQQRRAGAHLGVGDDFDRGHLTGVGRSDCRLHLHRLEHRHRVTGGHHVTGCDRYRDHERRPPGAHDPAVLAVDAVGPVVDDDAERSLLRLGDHPILPATAAHPSFVVVEHADPDVRHRPAVPHPVGAWGGAVDLEVVAGAGVAQLQLGTRALGPLGAPAPGTGVKRRLHRGMVGGVRLDGRDQQRDRGRFRKVLPGGRQAVEPPIVHVARTHLWGI